MTAHDCHQSCNILKLVLTTVTGQGSEFRERIGPTAGSEFGERTRANPGSAGSEFRERTGPNPGSVGSEFRERTGPNPGSAGSEFGERPVPFSEF